ncbi:hypothetical protein PC121_g17554 [Phytophthora cactorum]|nr:hypothetical protein PC120_g18518 [Phytophthora cactorum]KAG3051949.1 hypothetical protein PC121_g17554 [Phytophthora cactorum]
MPDQFGLIIDGWTHASEHYLAVFGCYMVGSTPSYPLLAMAPLLNEPGDDRSAETQLATCSHLRVTPLHNVSKYINDLITLVSDRLTKVFARCPPSCPPDSPVTPCVVDQLRTQTRHRNSRFSGSPHVELWLLDSLTKAFAYVGTTTREDQSVGKVLAGYKDPHLSCIKPSVTTLKELLPELEYAQLLTPRGQLFKNVSGFADSSHNVDTAVLDAALLIHLEDGATAVELDQAATGVTSHYLNRFHEALDTTNAALGEHLSLDTCTNWGRQLRTAWET